MQSPKVFPLTTYLDIYYLLQTNCHKTHGLGGGGQKPRFQFKFHPFGFKMFGFPLAIGFVNKIKSSPPN